MNRAAERAEGVKKEKLIGRKEKEIWNTEEIQKVLDDKMPRQNKSMSYQTPNGRKIYIVHDMYAYYIDNKVKGVFTFTKDITAITNMVMNMYDLQGKIIGNETNKIAENGTRYNLNDIIGESTIMKECVKDAYKVARHNSNILIYGETGTGKELFAQGIHNAGSNYNEPFIGLNCSAIPSNLIEGLLFGTKQGSFTGALDTDGLFEQAGKGTLFLDEINSMPIDMQAKLLRVLQEKRYRRIGDTEDKDVKCKIISSTNVEPDEAIKLGKLREDLYYRIAVVTIEVPPLRDRVSDICVSLNYFLNKYNRVFNTKIETIDSKLINECINYDWPGNVRELEHMVKGALNLCDGHEDLLTLDMFPKLANDEAMNNQNKSTKLVYWLSEDKIDLNQQLNNHEMKLIKNALMDNKGNIAAAARQLSIHRSVLYGKIKKLNIDVNEFENAY